MKKYLLITSFLILIPYTSVHGQQTDSLSSHPDFNAFFDARIGLAFQGSLNVESLWYKNKNALLLNTGIGFTTINNYWEFLIWALSDDLGEFYTGFSFSVTTTVLLGSLPYDQRSKHLDINVGVISLVDTNQIIPLPRATIGYRYQNPQTGKIFRIYGGLLSVGISFNL